MPVAITTSGYIEVYRAGVFISRHSVETKAVESAIGHAEINGDGDYELRFPSKTVAVDMSSLRRRIATVFAGAGGASSVATAAAVGSAQTSGGNTPGNPSFIDTFDYAVGRLDSQSSKNSAFTAHGWNGFRDEVSNPNGARGWLYTVDSIPGYAGSMPGLSSSGRVLCLEGRPSIGAPSNNQTDFYLQYGNSSGVHIPGNVWFQFWIYVNDYGTQQSRWANRNKLIYPSQTGVAPGSGTENAWLHAIRPNAQDDVNSYPGGTTPRCWNTTKLEAASDGTITTPYGNGYVSNNIDAATNFTEGNRWDLYKVHYDHSGSAGRYEVWRRTKGAPTWHKTTEWISGVTSGFTWIPASQMRAGHNLFKMPSTWGTAQVDATNYDVWMYMADFCFATAEADLPTYGSY